MPSPPPPSPPPSPPPVRRRRPAARHTSTLAPPTTGWFWSDFAGSCDAACERAGLKCLSNNARADAMPLIDEQSEWEAIASTATWQGTGDYPYQAGMGTARTARRGSSSTTSTASTLCTARATRPTAHPRRCAALPAGTLVTGRTMARHTQTARVLRLRLPRHVLGRPPPLLLLSRRCRPRLRHPVHPRCRRHPRRRRRAHPRPAAFATTQPATQAHLLTCHRRPTRRRRPRAHRATRGTWHLPAIGVRLRHDGDAVESARPAPSSWRRRRARRLAGLCSKATTLTPIVCAPGWGIVPVGCSVQTGGDWTAHYKTSGSVCTTHAMFSALPTRVLHDASEPAARGAATSVATA